MQRQSVPHADGAAQGNLTKPPEWRFRKANEGIDLLKKTTSYHCKSPTPVVYANLLFARALVRCGK